MIEIVLAGDPVGKGRPRFSRKSGTVYTPKKTASYENRLASAARSVMNGRPLLKKAVKVVIQAHMMIPISVTAKKRTKLINEGFHTKKPDIDNLVKCTLDSFNKVVWLDDSQVVELHVFKQYSLQPQIKIYVSEIAPLTSFF